MSYTKNLKIVFDRLLTMAEKDEDDAKVIMDEMNIMLNELQSSDFFGTEGQCDPRGDQRNSHFSMWNIEEDK